MGTNPLGLYVKVEIDAYCNSAYDYNQLSALPTKIKFKRFHSGKIQKGVVEGKFTNLELHNVLYLINRGMTTDEINELCTKYFKE